MIKIYKVKSNFYNFITMLPGIELEDSYINLVKSKYSYADLRFLFL